jgi:ATP-binding cassette subfamily F protein 3
LQRDDKEYNVKFIFSDPGPLSIPVVQIKDVTFGYSPEKILFRNVELNVGMESRVAIVGPNGIGKSTLMNLILGDLHPLTGEIIRNRKLRVSKFSQHFVDQLTMTDTPVQFVGKKFTELKPQEVRNTLGKFGLSGKTQLQPIQLLSGGQKSRVALCTLSLELPHILLLDEPTNHLDIQSVDALSEALSDFEGAVALISHDQRLISRVCNELWVCGDQKVQVYDGTFEEYRQELIDQMDDELFMDSDEERK